MAELDTLLLQVFERLRREGLPLGVSEYLVAIEAIQAGLGQEDAGSLKRLCRLLWAKSQEDLELFDLAFAQLVEPQLHTISKPQSNTFESTPGSKTPPSEASNPNSGTSESTQNLLENQLQKQPPPVTLQPSKSTNQSFVGKTELTDEPHRYQLTPRLPMNQRDMAGVWRQLRQPQQAGVPELDVDATINSISRTGLLLHPVLKPRRRNQARLVVLVDQQGSMAPFAPLIEATKESIFRGGLLGKTNLYYFHDCPQEYLYLSPNLIHALPLTDVLNEDAKGNSVLIISDAGAARGYYDGERVKETKKFLQTLCAYTYLYAWLNPMPKNRWQATTAEDIACMIPMYPLNREGLNDAVSILRGFPFPAGVGIDE